jgi:hypothetical protein
VFSLHGNMPCHTKLYVVLKTQRKIVKMKYVICLGYIKFLLLHKKSSGVPCNSMLKIEGTGSFCWNYRIMQCNYLNKIPLLLGKRQGNSL